MRALSFMSLAAGFVLLCGSPPCRAQTAPSDKAGSPQTLTGPGGKDSSSEPASDKAEGKHHGQAVTRSDPKTHVNALSPEEKRRAARARERAAGASKKKVGESAGTKPVEPPRSTARAAPPAKKQATESKPHSVATKKAKPQDTPVADLRRHARSPKSRSAYGGETRGAPRVGSVVPRGVPLYPVPPGYRTGGYYGSQPPWHYVPGPGYPPFPRVGNAYPPFPRDDMDDDDLY